MPKSKGSKRTTRFPTTNIAYLLEQGTLQSLRKAKEIAAARIKFEWDRYAELARQRNIIQDEIKKSLIQTSVAYEMEKWQRAVKYKYSLHPLSTQGSLSDIGGRFNTGKEVNSEVPFFPALYLAQDKDTALQEHLGHQKSPNIKKLTPRELALTNPASETIVTISGKLDKVFDLTSIDNLRLFVELIKKFTISKRLITRAKELGVLDLNLIKTARALHKSLLEPDWRQAPTLYDIPANSQIFGHLIYSAGIEGILYNSKFTNKPCLAIFPENFIGTDSFVCLNDDVPHIKVPKRLDANNWRVSEMSAKEILGEDR